ncbi:MAG: hypothetical protein Q8P76_01690 [bacterium]|nr:hypothetical protein [bacterium]
MSQLQLEMLRDASVSAGVNSIPAWISILVVAVFLTWATWYLTRKLDQEARDSKP